MNTETKILKNDNNRKLPYVVGLLFIVLIFVIISVLAQRYELQLTSFVSYGGYYSVILYIFITALAIIVAPISTLPLIPIASAMWGWQIAGLLSIVGWVIGSQIAFLIGRKVRGPLLNRFISLQKISDFENRFPEKNIFWTLIFLRIITPVDILSYAVGVFTKINNRIFIWSTIIGITPFAFIFSYGATLDIRNQFVVIIEIAAAFILLSFHKKNLKKTLLVLVLLVVSTVSIINRTEILSFVSNIESISAGNIFITSSILILLKVISAPLGFPGTPLTLLSGSLLGNFLGTVSALIGNTLGAGVAFLLSRYVLKDYVKNNFLSKHPRIQQYEERLEKRALPTIIILRLIPLFPFNALNFLLGITGVSFRNYLIGSFIGMIPGTALFVYFGGSLRAFSPLNITFAVLGILALIYFGKKVEKLNN